MTVEFERQEQERHRNEATFLSIVGSVTGLFSVHAPGREQRRDTPATVAIVSYENRLDAENDVELLACHGIEAVIELNSAGGSSWFGAPNIPCIELIVQSNDVRRAMEVLHKADQSPSPQEKSTPALEAVTFACEECGVMNSFPGNRRGKVETCPLCYEYVDVPDAEL